MRYTFKKTGEEKVDKLGRQFQKTVRCCNQAAISTRTTYIGIFERFIAHVGPKFNLQKIQNIQDKHLKSYAEELKNRGCDPEYIAKCLSAIRFLHNQINGTRYELSDANKFNKEVLNREESDKELKDRSWNDNEIEKFKEIAEKLGRIELIPIANISLAIGTRIDETVTLRSQQIKTAIEEGRIDLKNTKGGRPRTLYLSMDQRNILKEEFKNAGNMDKEYAFCPEHYVKDHKIHSFKKSVQNFLYNHREKFKDPERQQNITAHGWRHTSAQELDKRLQEKGYDLEKAAVKVRNYLGHGDNRPDISRTYLGR